VIFALMMTHVVTDLKNLNRLIWVLIVGALILGLQAWDTPRRAFEGGRLERVGGPDFSDCNFFAAYMAVMLPIIGVQFLRTGKYGKLLCLVSGVFTTNAIILTRSRSAVVGLAVGVLAAILLAPPRHRLKILLCLVVVLAGGLYLSDPQFLARTATIMSSEEERDSSAQSRVRLAKAGVQMVADHPLGVGPGNFYQHIGRYIPEYAGKDAHNTYVRCFTELGLQGGAVFLLLIGNAFAIPLKVRKQVVHFPKERRQDLIYLSHAMLVSISALLGCCLTISLTYVEFIWWFLALPVCLERVVQNLQQELDLTSAGVVEEEAVEPVLECATVG
jgi:O-antigen ligase